MSMKRWTWLLVAAMLMFVGVAMSGEAKAAGGYTILYHETNTSPASSLTTSGTLGVKTATRTLSELGFEQIGRVFLGWREYRSQDNTWAMQSNGKKDWLPLNNDGSLPEGWEYALGWDGDSLTTVAERGEVHFYAQWNEEGNTVVYYDEEGGNPVGESHLAYKIVSNIRTLEDLGLKKEGKIFVGWKLWRPLDSCWMVKNTVTGKGSWKQAPGENEEVAIYLDGDVLAGFYESGEVRLYAQWIETSLDVTDARFGAVPNDGRDDHAAIQQALAFAMHTDETLVVRVPKGQYHISESLVIYSNTKLILESGAVISCLNGTHLMLINGKTTADWPGGYGRSKDIVVQGGKWDGNGQGGNEHSDLIFFAHAENITIQGVEFVNCCGNHFIEFAGVNNGTVNNCHFKDFIRYKGINYESDEDTGDVTPISEAIQIDYTSGIGTGEGDAQGDAPADNTLSQNITVNNCTFDNCMSGIGNHHIYDRMTQGLKVSNNTFTNMYKDCINFYSFGSATISGNTATNVRRFVYSFRSNATQDSVMIENNTITNTDGGFVNREDAIVIVQSSNLTVRGNVIRGFRNGIHLNKAENITVTGKNEIDSIGEIGIKVVAGSATISNNTITNCALCSIRASGGATGTVEGNTYDIEYGILLYPDENDKMMTRGVNNLTGYDTELIDTYRIYYHLNENAPASEKTTLVTYGVSTPIPTVRELGFSTEGKLFAGWKIYRPDEKKWLVLDGAGKESWETDVPEGGAWSKLSDGVNVSKTVPKGRVAHFYATWEDQGEDYLPGDINGDGVVDGRDAIRLKRYLDNISKKKGETIKIVEKNADVNRDNWVKQDDLTMLLDYLAGVIDSL